MRKAANGTDWLRGLMRRKPKYATGGLVAAPQPDDPPITQGGCAWPADSVVVQLAAGTAVVPRDLSVPDELLAALNAPSVPSLPRRGRIAEPAWQMCPCIAIYSSCRCPER